MPKKIITQLDILEQILDELKLLRVQRQDAQTQTTQPKAEDIAPLPVPKGMKEKIEKQSEVDEKAKELEAQRFPVPPDFRNIVETVLNKEFGIEVNPLPNATAFNFTIIVPEHYSNEKKEAIEMNNGDRRSRVIDNNEGSNGVREWANKVLNNLDPETRTKISIARAQVKGVK